MNAPNWLSGMPSVLKRKCGQGRWPPCSHSKNSQAQKPHTWASCSNNSLSSRTVFLDGCVSFFWVLLWLECNSSELTDPRFLKCMDVSLSISCQDHPTSGALLWDMGQVVGNVSTHWRDSLVYSFYLAYLRASKITKLNELGTKSKPSFLSTFEFGKASVF